MNFSTTLPVAAAAAVVAALLASTSHAQTISSFGTLPGGGFSAATGVNSNGTRAVGYAEGPSNDFRVWWTPPPGGMTNLGLLSGGAVNSYGQAIDASGNFIAGYGDAFGPSRAYHRTINTGTDVLVPLLGGMNFSTASGISQNGQVVVGMQSVGSIQRAFRWDVGFPFCVDLGDISGQPLTARALAVSGNGAVVAGASGNLAFRYSTGGGGMVSLGTLPGQTFALGEGVNTDGSVITGRWSNGSDERGFRWTSATGMVNLPPVPGGGGNTLRPRAISGNGNIIVGQGPGVAFIWTSTHGTQSLATHLASRGVNLAGWNLTDATGISADGSAMCGRGALNGTPVGWVVSGLGCPTVQGWGFSASSGCPGSTVTFNAAATGTGLTYRWFRNGVQLVDGNQPSGSVITGALTSVMVLQGRTAADAGSYEPFVSSAGACEVPMGGPSTLAATLTGPSIANEPQPQSACTGVTVSIPMSASGQFSLLYRWQRHVPPFPNVYADIFDGPTGTGATLSGTGTPTLTITNAQPADTERYRCVVSDTVCGAATGTVTQRPLITITADTTILTSPVGTSQCQGPSGSASFSVVASPAGQVTYQWTKRQPPFPNVYAAISDGPTGNGGTYSGTTTPTLTINGLFPPDFDRYRCIVAGPCGFAQTSANALLSAVPDAAITSGPDDAVACLSFASSASFTVATTPAGNTFQWQKHIGPAQNSYASIFTGPTGNGGAYSGTQSPTLTITGILGPDFTGYRCLVTGPCGSNIAVSPRADLIQQDNPVIGGDPTGGIVCRNGSATLAIGLGVGNYGPVTFQWWRYVNAFPIFAPISNGSTPTGSIASGAQSGLLTISNFQPGDTGQYYVAVTGACGTTLSAVATLTHCPADYNCSGVVSVQDIFDFLAGYFNNDPAADINNSDSITVQDIFDYLAAYFTGCG